MNDPLKFFMCLHIVSVLNHINAITYKGSYSDGVAFSPTRAELLFTQQQSTNSVLLESRLIKYRLISTVIIYVNIYTMHIVSGKISLGKQFCIFFFSRAGSFLSNPH